MTVTRECESIGLPRRVCWDIKDYAVMHGESQSPRRSGSFESSCDLAPTVQHTIYGTALPVMGHGVALAREAWLCSSSNLRLSDEPDLTDRVLFAVNITCLQPQSPCMQLYMQTAASVHAILQAQACIEDLACVAACDPACI